MRIRDISDEQLETLVDKLKEEFNILYVIREDISEIPKKVMKDGD